MKKRAKISKEELIYDTLRGMCLRLGVNGRLPTVSQLCQSLETSCSTLDRVLRRLKGEQMIICRQGSGIYVSPLMTRRTIGLIFPGMLPAFQHSPFWSLTLKAAQELATERGHELRVYFDCPSIDSAQEDISNRFHVVRDIEEGRIDGFLTICLESQRRWLAQQRPPVVVYNHPGEGFPAVCIDLSEMVHEAVTALVSSGCQRIGCVTPQAPPSSEESNPEAISPIFCKELPNHGLEVNEAWIWHRPGATRGIPNLSAEEFGYHLALKVISESKRRLPFDGLVITDDMVARGFLTGMIRSGRQPDKDLKIATFSNAGSALLKAFEDVIYQVEISPAQIIAKMMSVLESAMNGQQIRTEKTLIHTRLIPPNSPRETEQRHQRIAKLLS